MTLGIRIKSLVLRALIGTLALTGGNQNKTSLYYHAYQTANKTHDRVCTIIAIKYKLTRGAWEINSFYHECRRMSSSGYIQEAR